MNESNIFGISWRGILAFIVMGTVCASVLLKIKVEEPLYSLVLLVAGAYFGQKTHTNGEVKANG